MAYYNIKPFSKGITDDLYRGNNSAASLMPTLTSMPSHSVTAMPIPSKRPVSITADYEVPDGIGILTPSETAVNGAFKNQPITQPQKSVFLTYEAGNEKYYDCKIPIKINIPGGDFGLYKLTINECLFRMDGSLLTTDDYFEIEFPEITIHDVVQVEIRPTVGNKTSFTRELGHDVIPATTIKFTMPNIYKGVAFYHLDLALLTTVLNTMIYDHRWENVIRVDEGGLASPNPIPVQVNINGTYLTYHFQANGVYGNGVDAEQVCLPYQDTMTVSLNQAFNVEANYASGNSLSIYLNTASIINKQKLCYIKDAKPNGITQEIYARYPNYIVAARTQYITVNGQFKMTCSDNFRNIFLPFNMVRQHTSKEIGIVNTELTTVMQVPGINISSLSFAGPLGFMLNTNAQTTCPIANEYGNQFNCCALSYNTNVESHQLVQMTSNIELILKEGSDLRIWLTDFYGNYVHIESPMYIQATIEPYTNQTSTGAQGEEK